MYILNILYLYLLQHSMMRHSMHDLNDMFDTL